MKRIYAIFLRLYPREYRDLFGTEVLDVFAQTAEENRRRGIGAWLLFLMVELSGAVASAARHWVDHFSPRDAAHLEFAGSNRMQLFSTVQEVQNRIDLNIKRMTQAIANHDFARARQYSYEERKTREELQRLRDFYGFDDDEQL